MRREQEAQEGVPVLLGDVDLIIGLVGPVRLRPRTIPAAGAAGEVLGLAPRVDGHVVPEDLALLVASRNRDWRRRPLFEEARRGRKVDGRDDGRGLIPRDRVA